MDTDSFRFMSADTLKIASISDVMTFRVSFTGECGYEMYVSKDQQLALFDILRKEGADLGLGLVGTRSLMQTRLEKSFMAWGLELSSDYFAHECEMMRHVKLGKGDFVGRDAVAAYVPAREKYATFTVDAGDCAIWGDEAIFLDGNPVGYVSSGGWGPITERHIALGYVHPDAYQPDGNYAVEILGQLRPAELQTVPLYDPSGARMRA